VPFIRWHSTAVDGDFLIGRISIGKVPGKTYSKGSFGVADHRLPCSRWTGRFKLLELEGILFDADERAQDRIGEFQLVEPDGDRVA
jgi:hypothetical protein